MLYFVPQVLNTANNMDQISQLLFDGITGSYDMAVSLFNMYRKPLYMEIGITVAVVAILFIIKSIKRAIGTIVHGATGNDILITGDNLNSRFKLGKVQELESRAELNNYKMQDYRNRWNFYKNKSNNSTMPPKLEGDYYISGGEKHYF